jgi:hypothetical protein
MTVAQRNGARVFILFYDDRAHPPRNNDTSIRLYKYNIISYDIATRNRIAPTAHRPYCVVRVVNRSRWPRRIIRSRVHVRISRLSSSVYRSHVGYRELVSGWRGRRMMNKHIIFIVVRLRSRFSVNAYLSEYGRVRFVGKQFLSDEILESRCAAFRHLLDMGRSRFVEQHDNERGVGMGVCVNVYLLFQCPR